jgi:hypothetical protein
MAILPLLLGLGSCGHYKNFKISVYCPSHEVAKMENATWLETTWKIITDQVKIDRIYLETHRDGQMVNDSLMEYAKKWFKEHGVETAGGITYTWGGGERSEAGQDMFSTFCMSDPVHRAKAQQLAEFTARHHDAFILDDFFFTSCKSEAEINAKGSRTWSDYRRAIMADAGRQLVTGAAHAVNPNVTAIIKYPNWYDHFPGLGFDLDVGPKIFDAIWTGTETRNPDGTQHLQNYLSYEVIRYFENVAPGRNGGGWVDTFDIARKTLGGDRYAEQLWLTLFAKAKEVALFAYNGMLDAKLEEIDRTIWQGQGSSFDWDTCTAPFTNENGETVTPTTFARIAGCVFEAVDKFVGKLGNPIGVKSYKPANSRNDDFLQNFLGMIGLPIEMVPTYPTNASTVLLTAGSGDDKDLAKKIVTTGRAGGNVWVTSGLIVEHPATVSELVEVAAKKDIIINQVKWPALTINGTVWPGGNATIRDVLVKQIWYQTNDAWEIINAGRPLVDGHWGVPLVLRGSYGQKGGNLYAFAVPEDPADIYHYPEGALNVIRKMFSRDLPVYFLGPAKVSIFLYDNGYFIVENFNDVGVDIRVVINHPAIVVEDPAQAIPPESDGTFAIHLNPHQYRVFLQARKQ